MAVDVRSTSAVVWTSGSARECSAATRDELDTQVMHLLLEAAQTADGGQVHVQMSGLEDAEFVLLASGDVEPVPSSWSSPPAAQETEGGFVDVVREMDGELVALNPSDELLNPLEVGPITRPAVAEVGSRRPVKLILMVTLAVILLLGTTGVVLMVSADGRDPAAVPAAASPTPSKQPASTTSPEPDQVTTSAAAGEPAPVVSVVARGGVASVELVVETTGDPRRVVVRLARNDGTKIGRYVKKVTELTTTVTVPDVPAGLVLWLVSVPGAEPVTGQVKVKPTSQPTPSPRPPSGGSTSGTGSSSGSTGSSGGSTGGGSSSKPKPKKGGSGPKGVNDGRGPVGQQDPAG